MAEETIEITRNQFALYQQAQKLLNGLVNHKEHGMQNKRALKALDPSLDIPEIDLIDNVTKPRDEKIEAVEKNAKELREELAAFKESLKTEKEEAKFTETLDSVKKKGGFTEEGWQKVIKRMQEKNNPDVEAAAAYVKSLEPAPKPSASSNLLPQGKNMWGTTGKDDAWAELNKNPERFAEEEITRIIEAPENYREFGGDL